MPNILSGTINASAPTNALVGTTPSVVVTANNDRVGLVLTNLSNGTIYIGIGNTSTLSAGIVITKDGGNWNMDEYTFSNQGISAVAHQANSILSIQELIK